MAQLARTEMNSTYFLILHGTGALSICHQLHSRPVNQPQGYDPTAVPCSCILFQIHVCFLNQLSSSLILRRMFIRMTGMTGQFNASVQSQINGQSTAPIGGTAAVPSATSAPAATTPALTTTKASLTTSSSASKTSGAAGAAKSGGANKLAGAGVTALGGVAIAVLNFIFY
jgi:hypothetical protein